jgi:hypothetical protein
MTVYATLISRIPPTVTTGKNKVIRSTLAAGLELQGAVASAASRDDLTPKGRAVLLAKGAAAAGAALLRSQRQHAYHAKKLAAQTAALRAKVIGEAKPTDAEWRTYLRSLDSGARTQLILSNPDARAAALREPGLSGATPELLVHAYDIAVQDAAPDEVAAIIAAEEAQEIHNAAIRVLTNEIMKAPFIVDDRGGARTLISPIEFDAWLAKEMPAVHPNAAIVEEAEADAVEEAA